MLFKNETEAGVREDARLENLAGGRDHVRAGWRGRDSTRARRRCEVKGEAPVVAR